MQRHESSSPVHKSQPQKLPKKMPIYKPKREQLVLLSPSSFKKFNVFTDVEIGITKSVQNKIIKSAGDEDYDSSDDVIQGGVKKCLKVLKKELSACHSERETEIDSQLSKDSANSCETELPQKVQSKVLE